MLDLREHSLHVREWLLGLLRYTYDMQLMYRRLQVRRNIHQDGMYRWKVRCVWRRRVQHLRRWKIFVRGPRNKLCEPPHELLGRPRTHARDGIRKWRVH